MVEFRVVYTRGCSAYICTARRRLAPPPRVCSGGAHTPRRPTTCRRAVHKTCPCAACAACAVRRRMCAAVGSRHRQAPARAVIDGEADHALAITNITSQCISGAALQPQVCRQDDKPVSRVLTSLEAFRRPDHLVRSSDFDKLSLSPPLSGWCSNASL